VEKGLITQGQTIRTPRVGDWVEVKTPEEILQTLDPNGDFEAMPFMPEMLKHSGRRFRISAVAHKTCDTVNKTGGRAVADAVHLEDLRCDGSAHGGCQATCLFFWKTAWLRTAAGPMHDVTADSSVADPTEARLSTTLITNASNTRPDGVQVYRCQATTLPQWSQPLKWWDVRQYWRDVSTGNVALTRAVSTVFLAAVYQLRKLPVGYRISCWLYGKLHLLLKGFPDPHGQGSIPRGTPTPDERLELKPGEFVEIRSKEDIFRTVNDHNKNRGLQVDEEMTRYCGGRFRVRSRVTQIINESTGEMMTFTNPCIVLEGVDCLGEYADRRLLCPRRITTYWREIWLTRVDEKRSPRPASSSSATSS
jgi:hypothetical protein